jgi:hypothetical protein
VALSYPWGQLFVHYDRKLSCKSKFFWSSGFWEDFQMTLPYFCIFVIISPLNRTWPLFEHANLNSLHVMDGEYQILLKFSLFFHYSAVISPCWKGVSFEQTWIPVPQGFFVQSLVKFGIVVLQKKSKMGRVNNGWSEKLLTFQLRWANKTWETLEYSSLLL